LNIVLFAPILLLVTLVAYELVPFLNTLLNKTFVGSITCKFEKVKTPLVKLSIEHVEFVGFDIDKSPLPLIAGSGKSKKNQL
jgi:hypothetical protein